MIGLTINPATELEKKTVELKLQEEEERKEALKWARSDWATISIAMKVAGVELTEDQEADIKDDLMAKKLAYVKGAEKLTSTGRKLAF